ncbi:MAG: protein translocase subunit SecF, partial [Firmicutes bacterium]|nr:protein translocase subunit SecF [Bacillota bacterium]
MNYGIDFTGGTKIQIDLGQYVDSASIEKTIKSYDLSDLQI